MIDSERLYLRPLTFNDVSQTYVSWLNDSEVNKFLEVRHQTHTLADVRAFVLSLNSKPNEHLFGIFLKPDRAGFQGPHIGNIKVGPIGKLHPVADISLFIGEKSTWGRGYATEAIKALANHSIENLGVRKLSASMYADNIGSYCAFLKAGFKREGVRRNHYILDGKLSDVIELGLLAAEIKDGKATQAAA